MRLDFELHEDLPYCSNCQEPFAPINSDARHPHRYCSHECEVVAAALEDEDIEEEEE